MKKISPQVTCGALMRFCLIYSTKITSPQIVPRSLIWVDSNFAGVFTVTTVTLTVVMKNYQPAVSSSLVLKIYAVFSQRVTVANQISCYSVGIKCFIRNTFQFLYKF